MRSILPLIFLFAPLASPAQSVLQTTPERPVGGKMITLRYQPSSKFLPLPSDSVVAEILSAEPASRVLDVTLRRVGRRFVGSVTLPPSAQLLFVRISIGDQVDDHEGDCWDFPIFDTAGKPVPGAHAQRSAAFRLGGLFGFVVRRDLDRALKESDDERRLQPTSSAGWIERWRTLRDLHGAESSELIRRELDSLLLSWSERQAEICELLPWLEQTGQPERLEQLESSWAERDPRGLIAQRRAWREASDERNPSDRLEKTEQVLRDFSLPADEEILLVLANTAIAGGRWDRADELIHRLPRKEPMLLDALVTRLMSANQTVERALVLAKEAVNAARNYDPALKPELLSLREYRKQRAVELPMTLGTYGNALRTLGYPALAEKVFAEAVMLTHGNDADLVRRLREVRAELGHADKPLETGH